MKSTHFRLISSTPKDVFEGMELTIDGDVDVRVTKIKSVKFPNKYSIEVIGLCKPIT